MPNCRAGSTACGLSADFASDEDWRSHQLILIWMMFRRQAFLRGTDGRSFHQVALEEGRNWEVRVRKSLADVVFGEVFPEAMRALVRADPDRPATLDPPYLATVRDAALTLLYRL